MKKNTMKRGLERFMKENTSGSDMKKSYKKFEKKNSKELCRVWKNLNEKNYHEKKFQKKNVSKKIKNKEAAVKKITTKKVISRKMLAKEATTRKQKWWKKTYKSTLREKLNGKIQNQMLQK